MGIYIPYTYLIGWSSLNKFYYGRRTAKGCSPTDLWSKYFTSSKVVKEYRKLHGEPDIIHIRQTFCDPKKCAQWESKVLERLDAQHNPKYLNQKNGDDKWDFTGKTHTKQDIIKQKKNQSNEWLLKLYNGDIILIQNLENFCENNKLDSSSLIKVALNKKKHYKGIQCRYNNQLFFPFYTLDEISPTTYIITSPKKDIYETYNLYQFCIYHNLDISKLLKVANGTCNHYKLWKVKFKNNIRNKFYTPLEISYTFN